MERKILFVVTSHGDLGYSGIRTGVCLDDFLLPYRRFTDASFCVVTASPAGGRVPVAAELEGGSSSCFRERRMGRHRALEESRPLNEVDPLEFDAVFYPGGHGVLWDVVPSRRNVRIVSSFFQRNCPVGAVGHGVAALMNGRNRDGSRVLSGRKITCRSRQQERSSGVADAMPFSVERCLQACGAHLSEGDEPGKRMDGPCVCIDGNLVTARDFRGIGGLLDAMLTLLEPMSLCRRLCQKS